MLSCSRRALTCRKSVICPHYFISSDTLYSSGHGKDSASIARCTRFHDALAGFDLAFCVHAATRHRSMPHTTRPQIRRSSIVSRMRTGPCAFITLFQTRGMTSASLVSKSGRAAREYRVEFEPPPGRACRPCLIPASDGACCHLFCHPGGYPASANPNKPNAGAQFEGSKLFNRTKSLVTDFYDESKGCDFTCRLSLLHMSSCGACICGLSDAAGGACDGFNRRETQSRGRAGTRWELEQTPAESGSRYGDSVFLDVYQAECKPPGSATVCL